MNDDEAVGILEVEDFPAPVWSDEYIRRQIPRYRWFVHTNFGNGIVARSTSWPDAPPDSPNMGLSKFDYIIHRNLPDLQGKRILEIGCNAGVMSIHMARLGAAEVVGIDSEASWPNWRMQAEFVQGALEWRCCTSYNVRYQECDMRRLPQLDLGRFDVVLALNCIYYIEEDQIRRLVRHLSMITDRLLVQCNTRDHPKLGRRPSPAFNAQVLRENGFPDVTIDWPWDRPWRGIWPRRYMRPVVVGAKESLSIPNC
jgi:SAM-dependent methyltransferase